MMLIPSCKMSFNNTNIWCVATVVVSILYLAKVDQRTEIYENIMVQYVVSVSILVNLTT